MFDCVFCLFMMYNKPCILHFSHPVKTNFCYLHHFCTIKYTALHIYIIFFLFHIFFLFFFFFFCCLLHVCDLFKSALTVSLNKQTKVHIHCFILLLVVLHYVIFQKQLCLWQWKPSRSLRTALTAALRPCRELHPNTPPSAPLASSSCGSSPSPTCSSRWVLQSPLSPTCSSRWVLQSPLSPTCSSRWVLESPLSPTCSSSWAL